MAHRRIGIQTQGGTFGEVFAQIRELEEKGVHAAWMATGSGPQDSLTVFAGAAAMTKDIVLGSSIVPTYPRHPIVAVQQAHVINEIAPGRFVLGIGASHEPRIEGNYRIQMKTPLNHTREYLQVARTLLHTGHIDFEGKQLSANMDFGKKAPDVPVMISALRKGSFELAGEMSDGAISWVCPGDYLREVALPAMRRGAEKAARSSVPPLVAHASICIHEDIKEVREGVDRQLAEYYLSFPFYRQMFVEAGYPEAESGVWSDRMLNDVVFWGNQEKVAQGLMGLFEKGASEIIVSIVTAGKDRNTSRKRGVDVVANLCKDL